MSQTKENRIKKHFQAEIDRRQFAYETERDRQGLTHIPQDKGEGKAAWDEIYNGTILFLAEKWKMKCREIKDAINVAKKQNGGDVCKYDSRTRGHRIL